MNPDLNLLHPYPFEKLNQLKAGITPLAHLKHIALSIGEPKHTTPQFVIDTLKNSLGYLSSYPTTKGLPELREAIAQWAIKRFYLDQFNPETEALPVNGTREALFAFVQAVIDKSNAPDKNTKNTKPIVMMPNPFYQIYEGAAFLAGAEPYYLNCTQDNNDLPDLDSIPEEIWQRCQLFFICTPGNPTGATCDSAYFKKLIALSDIYNFIIASDECYSELYFDETQPPIGLLQACAELGRNNYRNCVVFHSLSKRSNLPGLRSGFVAGDASVLKSFLRYRTYHGCAMPVQHQLASIAAWQDEEHVIENRKLYRQKFSAVMDILKPILPDLIIPPASFYLWPDISAITSCQKNNVTNEQDFSRELFTQQHITTLPGSYLGRAVNGENPGANRIRIALVAPLDECIEAAQRIKSFIESL